MDWKVVFLVLFASLFMLSHYVVHEQEGNYVTGHGFSRYVVYDVECNRDVAGGAVYLDYPSDLNLGRDFVFTDEAGRVFPVYGVVAGNIPYWIERGASGSPTKVWIKVPYIPAGGSVTVYARKEAGFSPNGEEVFEFFDDFEDVSKWVMHATYTLQDGELLIDKGHAYVQLPFNLQDNYTVEARVNVVENSTYGYSGTFPEVCSSYYTLVDNGNSDATLLYMVGGGSGETGVYHFIGDGSSASYNVGTGRVTTISIGEYHVMGATITPSSVILYKDYSVVKSVSNIVWRKEMHYIHIGVFNASQGYDIKDTKYDWIRVRKYAPSEPTVTVTDKGSCYEITISNPNDYDLNDFQVPIPADQLDVSSVDESIAFYSVVYPVISCSSGDSLRIFLLYNGDANVGVPHVPDAELYRLPYTVTAPEPVSLYSGSAAVSVSPDTAEPGEKNVSIVVYTESPYGVGHVHCTLDYSGPVTDIPVHLESESNASEVSFTVNLNEEGVYLFEYNCAVFFTDYIAGSFTRTVYIPDPSVPALELSVSGIPSSLASEQNVEAVVRVTSDGVPVSGVDCYLDYSGTVLTDSTGPDGTASFVFLAFPDSSGTVSCYRSGYHPAYYSFHISRQETGGGVPPSGGGAGGVAPSPSGPSRETGTEGARLPAVQPASPVPSGVTSLGIIVAGLVIVVVVGIILVRGVRR